MGNNFETRESPKENSKKSKLQPLPPFQSAYLWHSHFLLATEIVHCLTSLFLLILKD